MKHMATAAALLAATCLLSACGPDMGWSKKGVHESTWKIDEKNCAWEATHERLDDGTFAAVERSDDEIEDLVRKCLEAQGYTWGTIEE